MIQNQRELSHNFEIVVAVLDSQGNDTGKRKSYSSDSAYKIWEFWNQQGRKPKKSKVGLPNAQEAATLLAQINT